MDKNLKGIIAVIIVIAIIAAVYFLFIKKDGSDLFKQGPMDRNRAIKTIINAKPGRTAASFATFGDDYLIAWASQIKANEVGAQTGGMASFGYFTVGGRKYDVGTGKSV